MVWFVVIKFIGIFIILFGVIFFLFGVLKRCWLLLLIESYWGVLVSVYVRGKFEVKVEGEKINVKGWLN